jgi:hypothetical protein
MLYPLMKTRMNKTQKNVLARMIFNQWYNAYTLRCSLATLEALRRKKLVEEKTSIGSFFSPRIVILGKKSRN